MQLPAIFEDAANLDAGQSKDLAIDLQMIAVLVRRLEGKQVFRLAGERNNRTVGVNGATLDLVYL